MNLQDGSWIASYFIENDELWAKVKEGKFGGFSVEGWFDKVKIKTDKMNKKKTSIWDLFTKEKPAAEAFAQAVTAEGVAVFYEGDLVEGTAVFIELEGERIPAPEGEHELTLEDGSVKVITLNSDGVITAVADVETMTDDTTEEDPAVSAEDEMRAEVAEAMRKQTTEIHERFTALEGKLAAIEAENKALKSEMATIQEALYELVRDHCDAFEPDYDEDGELEEGYARYGTGEDGWVS